MKTLKAAAPITAREVQNALYRNFASASALVIPNYTPAGWWEADVLQVTKAGYGTEYEIKLTRSDFKRDADKGRHTRELIEPDKGYTYGNLRDVHTKKHDCLLARSEAGPSRFFYCLPLGLVTAAEVPEWAGFIEFERRPYGGGLWIHERRKAPRLHKKKVTEDVLRHAYGVFFFRYWRLRLGQPEDGPAEALAVEEAPDVPNMTAETLAELQAATARLRKGIK